MATKSDQKAELPYLPRPTSNRSPEATEWLENLETKAEDPEFWEQPPISERIAKALKEAGLKK